MTQRGVTVIEMLVVIAITSLIVIALAVLFGRGIGSYRTQFQQVLTTEDARVQLERISDAVRNARDAGANRWLLIGEPNQLQITTNIDADPAAETVRYFVEDSNLRRGVIDDDGGEETIVTLARSLRNTSQGQDLFAYYDRDGNALSGSVTPDNVARIGLTMLFDADENNEPGIATITTTILPRQQAAGLVNGALLPTRLNYPIGDPLEHTTVAVSVTDGEGAETTELIDMTVLNDGQLVTYQNSHPIHINYQTITVDDDPPGWYAWIGPILVGRVGSQGYYQIDKMTVQELCQGQDLAAILASCETRTLSQGSLTYQYKPVVVYQPGGQRGYMRDLDFENIEEADPPGVLIAYWKFDEGSPEESTVGDSAGSYDGSMINFNQQSAWQAPAPGIQFTNPYSLSFDGNEGRYVDAGDVTELNDAQYFTMAAWMKRGTANSGLVMGKTGGTDGVGVTFGSFNTPYFYVRVANEIGIGNAGYGSFYDPDGDAWHHYAVVYDGTQTGNENRLKVYKDGVQQTLDFEENTVPDRTPDLTDTSFEIGGSLGENYSTGFIDDVRIYSRALFSSEIASLAAGNDVQ